MPCCLSPCTSLFFSILNLLIVSYSVVLLTGVSPIHSSVASSNAVGSFLLLMGFMGFILSFKRTTGFLIFFITAILSLAIYQAVFAGMTLEKGKNISNIEAKADQLWIEQLKPAEKSVFQQTQQCCGLISVDDDVEEPCSFKEPCRPKLVSLTQRYIQNGVNLTFGFFAVQLVAVLMAIFMIATERKYEQLEIIPDVQPSKLVQRRGTIRV